MAFGQIASGDFPDLLINEEADEFSPAVGYTGEGGVGLTAQGVLQGRPIVNNLQTAPGGVTGPGVYTSYEGLKNLLEYIDSQMSFYRDNTDQEGTVSIGGNNVSFNAFNFGSFDSDGSYPQFNFTGSLLDIIPNGSTAYTNVYNAIASLLGPISVDPGQIDLEQIVGIVNNAVNESILYRTENIRTVLKNVEFEGGALGTADFKGRIDSDPEAGDSIPLRFKNADLNGDGAVATSDLLEFLGAFGQSVDNQDLEDRTNDILDLLDEFNYNNVTVGAPGGNPNLPQTNTDFIDALIANINGLSNLLPQGQFFAFDNDPLIPIDGSPNPRYGKIYIDTTGGA